MVWIFSALGLFLGWLSLKDVHWPAFLQAFGAADPLWLTLFVLCMAGMIHLRTIRWEGMIRPFVGAGFDAWFVRLTTWVGFAAVLVFPLRSGELYRCAIFHSRDGRPGSRGPVFGALLMERALDGLAVVGLIALGFGGALASDNPVSPGIWGFWAATLLVFALMTAMLVWTARSPHAAVGFFLRFGGVRWAAQRFVRLQPLPAWFERAGERISMGVRECLAGHVLARTIFFTLAYWGMNVAGAYFLLRSFHLPGGSAAAALVVGFSAVGVFIPGAPGHVGNFHEFARLGLSSRLSRALVAGPGMAFVVVLHAVQTLLYLTLGAVGLAGLAWANRRRKKADK